jgi:VIT1/CCC1 family predicted Fe2+/Mn2+ transporter
MILRGILIHRRKAMSLLKRVDKARKAYADGDVDASAQAHTTAAIAHAAIEEHGGLGSDYIGDIVYGGLDGIITTFAVVSGVVGAKLGTHIILILGLANLLADGFSMAVGAFLSKRSEQEYYRREREREAWEVEHFPEGERAELIAIYEVQGYSSAEATQLVEIISRDKDRWIDAMMIDELGLMRDDSSALKNGLATFCAFGIAGSVPLLVYLAGLLISIPASNEFMISIVLSGVALFGLGAGKVKLTGLDWWKSGLEMLLVGGLAAGVAYGVGALLSGIGA